MDTAAESDPAAELDPATEETEDLEADAKNKDRKGADDPGIRNQVFLICKIF